MRVIVVMTGLIHVMRRDMHKYAESGTRKIMVVITCRKIL